MKFRRKIFRWMDIPCLILILALVWVLSPHLPALARPLDGTYTVTDSGSDADIDPGDGFCLTATARCTLRAALQEANNDNGPSVIHFNAPMDINYPNLPILTEDGSTIDASDQWQGTWPNGEPGVSIGGGDPVLTIHSNSNTIYGILWNGSATMIRIENSAGSNIIGGTSAGQRNVLIAYTGVHIQTSGTDNAVVGNYFGTRDGFTPITNFGQVGISVSATNTRIEENLITEQAQAGILIWGGSQTSVQNTNIIGLDALHQSAMPNKVGIYIDFGHNNLIKNNEIGGNTSHGIELHHGDQNQLLGNIMDDNGGDGIHLFDANFNQIGGNLAGNIIRNSGGDGIWLFGDDNHLQGNSLSGGSQHGIYLDFGQDNLIGGGGSTLGNKIDDNAGDGIHLAGSVISSTIQGNTIGLLSGAFDGGNDGYGIFLDDGASQNHIGGLGANDGNWIGWNGLSGIYLTGANTQGNVLEGNVIGAPVNWGWAAPNGNNGIGIYNGAHHNWIGWNNSILTSLWSGVAIVSSSNNVVWLNNIGTHGDSADWGNSYYGVVVVNGDSNAIFGNQIGHNGSSSGQAGVRIDSGLAGNPINANSIHDNLGSGIELVNGGNFGLGAPSINQASCQPQAGAQGLVQGVSCAGCTIEIFSDAADEGRVYGGTTTADASSGAFSWQGTLHGPNVTATATTALGATSAFSTPAAVGVCQLPTNLYLPLIAK